MPTLCRYVCKMYKYKTRVFLKKRFINITLVFQLYFVYLFQYVCLYTAYYDQQTHL